MPHEDDEWDLNSPRRHFDAMPASKIAGQVQAESAVDIGTAPAEVPDSPEHPDGLLWYA